MKKTTKQKKADWEINEPRFNILNYNESLLTNLNYYSVEVDSKLKQQWAIEYYDSQGMDTGGLDKLNPMLFDQVGVLVRLINRGVELSERNNSYLLNKYHILTELIPVKSERKERVSDKPKSEVVKNYTNADKLLSEVDAEVDAILADEVEIKPIRIKLLIQELNLKKDDFIYIKEYLSKQTNYYTEILNDKGDLAEGYSHIPKKCLKRLIKFLEEVVAMCGVSRILRDKQPKAKSPSVLVKSLQYLHKDAGLGITSIKPEKIIDSNEVWLFDTEKRKLSKYRSASGNKLTVKGTTILNWDFELSSQKTVRKPNEVLPKIISCNKSEAHKLFESIKSVDMEVKGRTNKNVLLLRVF